MSRHHSTTTTMEAFWNPVTAIPIVFVSLAIWGLIRFVKVVDQLAQTIATLLERVVRLESAVFGMPHGSPSEVQSKLVRKHTHQQPQ